MKRITLAILRLMRPPSSLLTFLAVFLPVFVRTGNSLLGLRRATPLLFASICIFVVNDLHDIEKDKINHPERPLPSGKLTPAFVTSLYLLCLVAALVTTRFLVTNSAAAFWYYLALLVGVSYGYIVDFLPGIKSAYVACAASIPMLILASYYPGATKFYFVAIALGIFTLGRELCKDLCDRNGDPVSFLHSVEPQKVSTVAFILQTMGLLLLASTIAKLLDLLIVLTMLLLLALSSVWWFRFQRATLSLSVMKAVMFLGLYFLL